MPNEETFPFTEISVKLYDGTSFTLDESELAAALQYIPTQGYPPLLQVNYYYACGLCVSIFLDHRDQRYQAREREHLKIWADLISLCAIVGQAQIMLADHEI